MIDRSLEQPSPLFAALEIEPSTRPRDLRATSPEGNAPSQLTKCKSCGEEIVWAMTEGGKTAPFNAKTEAGLFVIDAAGVAHNVKVRKSHFATCPQADQHRKPS